SSRAPDRAASRECSRRPLLVRTHGPLAELLHPSLLGFVPLFEDDPPVVRDLLVGSVDRVDRTLEALCLLGRFQIFFGSELEHVPRKRILQSGKYTFAKLPLHFEGPCA